MVPKRSAEARRELVESLLCSDLAARKEAFFKEINELVVAAGSNRYSTGLVSMMEDAGRRELRKRADNIQAAWRRVIISVPGDGEEDISDAIAHAAGRLAEERTSIEREVLGVQMGSTPQHPGFLSETEDLLRKRLHAELQLPDPVGGVTNHHPSTSDEIVELKPNFFGFGLNLRALGRRVTSWWKGR